jgi:oxygen-independent coproporphyrinogen III oxidase
LSKKNDIKYSYTDIFASGRKGGALYIHIPFCKQACHYCDFHFSTSMKYKNEMVAALAKEIVLRKKEFENDLVETIYFGGGTPSRLPKEDLKLLIDSVFDNYLIAENPEITIEANPDDLNEKYLIELKNIGVNRLSIGIQSFFEADLLMMNRAHNASEAKECLEIAVQYFDNISVDLIYGIPGLSDENWQKSIETVLGFGIKHLSSYALTVEPKTALKKMIADGKIAAPKDDVAENHFRILTEILEEKGFIHYELSNFGKENYFSRNNSSYWLGKKYIGIGPSAHSFNGNQRSWNLSNNNLYIKSIQENIVPNEVENLSLTDSYNEYIMTGLRTIWGVSLLKIEKVYGEKYIKYLTKQSEKHLQNKFLLLEDNVLKTTKKGKFLTDGIASDLFYLD